MLTQNKCPNCGAPVQGHNCPYCRSVFNAPIADAPVMPITPVTPVQYIPLRIEYSEPVEAPIDPFLAEDDKPSVPANWTGWVFILLLIGLLLYGLGITGAILALGILVALIGFALGTVKLV